MPTVIGLVLPTVVKVETPKNHVMFFVVSRFPDRDILDKQRSVPKNVVRPGSYHIPLPDRAPSLAVMHP